MKYKIDLDLDNNEILNVLLQDVTTLPTGVAGQILRHNNKPKFCTSPGNWIDLSDVYSHPTHSSFSGSLTGAKVLANIDVNSKGHVTAASTRTLTLGDLGFTGDANANNYSHPLDGGGSINNLSSVEVVNDIQVNTKGHVTSMGTRTLTASDIAAIMINDNVTANNTTWSSTMISSEISDLQNQINSSTAFQGSFNPSTNTPDLTTLADISQGDQWVVVASGSLYGESLQTGDLVIAKVDNPSAGSDWVYINKNIPNILDATKTEKGVVRFATDSEFNASNTSVAVDPDQIRRYLSDIASRLSFSTSIGDGSKESFTVFHGLGTQDVIVQTFDNSSDEEVKAGVSIVDNNNINVAFSTAIPNSRIKVIVKGDIVSSLNI